MKFFELSMDHLGEVKGLFTPDDIALENNFLNPQEDRYKMYGYVDGNFRSVVSIIDSIVVPAWSLSKCHSHGSIEKQFTILKDIIPLKEKQSLYQFFTVVNDKELEFLQTRLARYQPYLEHVVSPDSLTGYENIDHDVLEYQKFDQNLFIYLWVLKNEYRPF